WARLYLQCRVFHPERIPKTGPVLLAANHVSFGDPPLIGACVPRAICFLARQSLFDHAWFARLIRSLNAVPVDRDGGGPSGLRTVLELLEQERVVLLFPEGTRSTDGRLQEARNGVGLAVLRSGAPVVPVRTFGLAPLWGRGKAFPRPGRIVIKFGHPLRFERERAELATASRARTKALYDEVTREVMSGIARLEPCRDVERWPG
ncbi:MAG: 1-acyl-sn-glycerol-3-phosphate acyltransferase, partial [Verrucomicrobiae bacterium]|nr:1-acyl-sn-glycerol-3-phosphate acyltransferase [Verrucomicrobiae bacterium]